MNEPGIDATTFKITLSKDDFGKQHPMDGKYEVMNSPYKSKWNLFFEKISFGLYKAPWTYTLKPYNNDINSKS